ncbi:MAG: MFS transporter [Vulcanimicrobiaceae bacterium]
MRDLFSERRFLSYFLARQGGLIGYATEAVAVSWQIYALHHRALDLAFVGLILFVPQLLLAIPAGLLADRVDRRSVVMLTSLGEMLGVVLFAVLAARGVHIRWPYFCVLGLVGVMHATAAPAERSILAGIVRGAHFVRAQAFTSSIGQVINVAAPAVGGLLLALGAPWAFAFAGVGYLLAAIGYATLDARGQADSGVGGAIDGIRFLFAHPIVLGAISLDLFAVLFGGATALLPIFATSILHVGPVGFGLLRSAPAIGAGIVAYLISRRPVRRQAGRLLFSCVAAFGVATIVFGVSRNIWLSAIALLATGAFDMVSVVIRMALVQLGTPDALRGRVTAVENIFIGASNELGAFESGAVAAWLGAEASVVLGGIATLAVIALWAAFFPALRRLDDLHREQA